ncbi:putative lysosomal acid lipase/cholesteryl ester hydrolase [Elgaria multicarinata webbii]|uniref:putative lysosomal acid lipase/cholesteryl ester hydrolase n=1 Tax=Elgaria multicarinata webbii TaxID=159646 RepID=UPI002FCD2EE7
MVLQGIVHPEEMRSKTEKNPEQFMNISEIIRYRGYPSKEYEVLTEDGYYLSLNRIPGGEGKSGVMSPRPAVLLIPGLIMESSPWVSNLPNNSLGFILADAGYDVWLGNVRGTTWSRRHQNLSISQQEFWNFSFHEMGLYDLPAMIDFILKKTGQKQIYYVGHSQGATLGFIAFSMLPEVAAKTKLFFVFAPAYTFHNSIGPVIQLFFLPDMLLKIIFGTKEFRLLSTHLRALLAKLCSYRPLQKLCAQGLFLISGFDKNSLNVSRVDVYMAHFPDFTSVKNALHFGQAAKTGEFKYFDYGRRNKEIYNQTTPPFYKIEDMTVPTAVWTGDHDWLSRPKDNAELVPRITNLINFQSFPDWNHWDFLWGLDAPQRLYTDVIDMMKRMMGSSSWTTPSISSLLSLLNVATNPTILAAFATFAATASAAAPTCPACISPIVSLACLPETLFKVIFGKKEFCLLSPKLRAFVAQKCSSELLDWLCKQALLLVSVFNEDNLNESRSDVYLARFPDYTSVKNIIHWGQSIKTGKFSYFDYGSKNIDKYNQMTPPFYRIEEITVPIAMWSRGQDWICQPKEVAQLWSRITNLIHYKEFPDWNHWDYIWGLNADLRMYAKVLGLMEKKL